MGRGFFVEVAAAELGVVAVGVEQRVRAAGLVPVGLGDGRYEPAVVRGASYAKDPQGHRDGDFVSGELVHEPWGHLPLAGEEPFPGRFA